MLNLPKIYQKSTTILFKICFYGAIFIMFVSHVKYKIDIVSQGAVHSADHV